MAWVKVQEAFADDNNTSSTSKAISFSAATANNLLVLIGAIDKTMGTPTAPSGWTLVSDYVSGSNASSVMFYKIAAGGETSATWTHSTGNRGVTQFYEYSGNATSSVLDISAKTDQSTAGSSKTITTTTGSNVSTDGSLALVGACWDSATAYTSGMSISGTGGSWTLLNEHRYDLIDASGQALNVSGSQTVNSGATCTATTAFTTGGGDDNTQVLAVFKPAATATDYPLTVSTAAVTLTGSSVALKITRTLPVSTSAVTLTGSSVALKKTKILPVTTRAIALTGSAVALGRTWVAPVSTAAVALTGSSIALKIAKSLAVDTSAVTLTGSEVAMPINRPLAVDTAAVTLTGSSVAMRIDKVLAVDTAAVTLTGSSVTMTRTWVLPVDTAEVTLTGSNIGLSTVGAIMLAVTPAAVTLTGSEVGFNRSISMSVDSGTITLTGGSITMTIPVPVEEPAAGGGSGGRRRVSPKKRLRRLETLKEYVERKTREKEAITQADVRKVRELSNGQIEMQLVPDQSVKDLLSELNSVSSSISKLSSVVRAEMDDLSKIREQRAKEQEKKAQEQALIRQAAEHEQMLIEEEALAVAIILAAA